MEDDAPLVLAMPRRELFRIQGFVPPHDLAVLESLAEESWYASPQVLSGDFDAKEVRIGLVVMKTDHVLLSEGGVLLHSTPVPPETAQLGTGLGALKHFGLAAGRHLLGITTGRLELVGFCNEDALLECRGIFILVYKFKVADDTSAPPAMSWVHLQTLPSIPIDPVSALVLEAVR